MSQLCDAYDQPISSEKRFGTAQCSCPIHLVESIKVRLSRPRYLVETKAVCEQSGQQDWQEPFNITPADFA